jgi:16S rRNA (guanine527-N7)-methyltransferase
VDTVEIDRLLQPFAKLDEQRLALTSIYIDLLLKWNARINLTAIREPREMVIRHFGESFFAAEILRPYTPADLIDLGSGAGFPGIPIAMWLPKTRVTLIESNQKKATFLKEVAFRLELKNVIVFNDRAEDYRGKAGLVTLRAVERFERVLPIVVALTGQEGRIALMIGESQVQAARALAGEVSWAEAVPVPGGHSRILLVGTKDAKVEQR